MPLNTEQLENILISKQVTPTSMRLLVLDTLMQQQSTVSLAQLEKKLEHTDRITLYRTLKTLEQKGIIHSINDGSAARYALCNDCSGPVHNDAHIHFYCTECRQTVCLTTVPAPPVDVPRAFRLHELSMIAKGICDRCSGTMQ
jgi:Fur family ferric uptake transcriptional regulator